VIVGKPFLTVNQIQDRVKALAEKISADYEGKELLIVPILRGAFMFASDLVRSVRIPITIDFVMVESYVETSTTGKVKVHCKVRESMKGRDVLIVEDIADTGSPLIT